ncbi:Aspartyl-tRNA(Asn)/glutamyl-tRNA(Gln) amidotransferase subunit A OS=Castellaniella defragrans OX=75697 GN=HNR28_003073 PE=3 SV=1 [Castellaniella defragrans]
MGVSNSVDTETLAAAAEAIRTRALTATQLLSVVVERLRSTEPVVHAYRYVDLDGAERAAREADREIAKNGPRGPLHGIPIGVKDLFEVDGMPTSAGSRLFEHHVSTCDAAAVARLRGAGAIILGKQHTHEFGVGVDVPPTRSPWDLERYPGGSTVGGAASVAAGSCLMALGTDGGGSIRKPAAINGLVGFKPTLGAVSPAGIFPGAASVDHVGWITRTVEDARLVWEIFGRHDPYAHAHDVSVTLRVGCIESAFKGLDPAIEVSVERALAKLRDAGVQIQWLDDPLFDQALAMHGTIVGYELYQRHRRWMEESPERYDPKTLHCLLGGANLTQDAVTAARERQAALTQALEAQFRLSGIAALCSPTVPISSERIVDMDAEKTLVNYIRLTVPFNLTGQPAISIPCGLADDTGMPVGLQIATVRHTENTLLEVAARVEAMDLWRHPSPPALAGIV